MKERFSAGGSVALWMKSSVAALNAAGFEDVETDETEASVTGTKDGAFKVRFKPLDSAKVAMEIISDAPENIHLYKKNVAPILQQMLREQQHETQEEEPLGQLPQENQPKAEARFKNAYGQSAAAEPTEPDGTTRPAVVMTDEGKAEPEAQQADHSAETDEAKKPEQESAAARFAQTDFTVPPTLSHNAISDSLIIGTDDKNTTRVKMPPAAYMRTHIPPKEDAVAAKQAPASQTPIETEAASTAPDTMTETVPAHTAADTAAETEPAPAAPEAATETPAAEPESVTKTPAAEPEPKSEDTDSTDQEKPAQTSEAVQAPAARSLADTAELPLATDVTPLVCEEASEECFTAPIIPAALSVDTESIPTEQIVELTTPETEDGQPAEDIESFKQELKDVDSNINPDLTPVDNPTTTTDYVNNLLCEEKNDADAYAPPKTPWYKSDWMTMLMLILVPPLGIYLMWANKVYTLKARKYITVFLCIYTVLWVWMLTLPFLPTKTVDETGTTEPVEDTTPSAAEQIDGYWNTDAVANYTAQMPALVNTYNELVGGGLLGTAEGNQSATDTLNSITALDNAVLAVPSLGQENAAFSLQQKVNQAATDYNNAAGAINAALAAGDSAALDAANAQWTQAGQVYGEIANVYEQSVQAASAQAGQQIQTPEAAPTEDAAQSAEQPETQTQPAEAVPAQ